MSDRIVDRASMYGPATCGCVALSKTWDAEHLTYEQQAKFPEYRGWARCPICKGSGVDPRVRPLFQSEPVKLNVIHHPPLDAIGIETSTAGRIGKVSCR